MIESIRRYVFVDHAEGGQSKQQHALGLKLNGEVQTDIEAISIMVGNLYHDENELSGSNELKAIQSVLPELEAQLKAILFLGRASQTLLAPTIARSTAEGSLMRKRLKPVFEPILMNLRQLQSF